MDMLLNQYIVRYEAELRLREAEERRLTQALPIPDPHRVHALEAWLGHRLLELSRSLLRLAGEGEDRRDQPRLPSPT